MHQFSCAYFLAALVLMLVTAPFLEHLPGGNLIATLAMTLVLMSAVLAIGSRRETLAVAIVLVVPALLAKWVEQVRPDLLPPGTFQAAGILFVAYVVTHLLRSILRAPRVDSEVLCAGIGTYLMLGVLWMLGYVLVARVAPDSFAFNVGSVSSRSMDGFNALYFSFVTLSTVGFGDIVPVSGAARMLAMTEAIAGLFYMTLLIARLVAIYSAERPVELRNEQASAADHSAVTKKGTLSD